MSGFLPSSRASIILDLIVLAMALVIPIMLYSLAVVKRDKNYHKHRLIQISLGLTLGLAILAFEIDMRLNGWRHLAEASPFYHSLVFPALYVHLAFAVPTLFLWLYTITMALRQEITNPTRSRQRFRHKTFGRLSAFSMMGTALTGLIFYWIAFMA